MYELLEHSVEGSHLLHNHNGSLNKPLNSTHSDASVTPNAVVASSKHSLMIYSLLFVLGYLVLGVVAYTSLAGMSALDSVYFCIGERDRNSKGGFCKVNTPDVPY